MLRTKIGRNYFLLSKTKLTTADLNGYGSVDVGRCIKSPPETWVWSDKTLHVDLGSQHTGGSWWWHCPPSARIGIKAYPHKTSEPRTWSLPRSCVWVPLVLAETLVVYSSASFYNTLSGPLSDDIGIYNPSTARSGLVQSVLVHPLISHEIIQVTICPVPWDIPVGVGVRDFVGWREDGRALLLRCCSSCYHY